MEALDDVIHTWSRIPLARSVVIFERAVDAIPTHPQVHVPLAHPALRAELEHHATEVAPDLIP